MNPDFSLPGPDSLTGAILAIEGITDAAVLLNGPTGCKFYHGALAEAQLPRENSYDPLRFLEEFYFGQPRVPATYLDGEDYVFGATDKLERILPAVAARGHGLLAVINSPGAALIGDDLDRFVHRAQLDVPCVTLESTGYSSGCEDGFQTAVIQTLSLLDPPPMSPCNRTVNLIGLTVTQTHWQGNVTELKRLLNLCGIDVGVTLCAGTSVQQLHPLRQASLNVMVQEEFGAALSTWCEQQYGLATLRPCNGVPIGFDATEQWLTEVCTALQADPTPGLAALEQARKRAVMFIKRLNSMTGLPKGATFAIKAPSSLALPLTQWLYHYLGMVPVAVRSTNPDSSLGQDLRGFLHTINAAHAWQSPHLHHADCLLADGATLARVQGLCPTTTGIEIALPSSGYLHVINKCLLGACGALYLLEWILNGLKDRA